MAEAPREEQPSSSCHHLGLRPAQLGLPGGQQVLDLAGEARGLSGFRKEHGGSGTVLESQFLLGRWDTGTATPAHPPTCHVTLVGSSIQQRDTTHGALSLVGYGLSVTGDPTLSF